MVIGALAFSGTTLEQLLISGIFAGISYALVAVGFGLIIGVTGRFHIAYGAIYALAAFVAGQVGMSWGLPYALSLLLGVAASMLLALLIERLVYWPLNRKLGAAALITIFIVSLGLSTMIENAISLIWINDQTLSMTGFTISSVTIFSTPSTNIAILAFAVGCVALTLVWAVMRWTKLGRMIRAIGANPELGLSVGIDPKLIYGAVFLIGTALGGLDAVFTATQQTATAQMGETPVLYAITIAFIARSTSPVVITAVALLVGLVESLSAFFVQSEWQQVVVFGGLLIYVLVIALRTNVQAAMSRRPRAALAVVDSSNTSS